ncbi:MAG: ATP-dependent helicase, partial [Ruminococcus sp.]|nr:ATP-dependent helicase [Ruminococcus sp.]
IVNNFRFYAVFQENEEYTVRCESQELGTLVMPPPVGEKIAIAGQVWIVTELDHKRHLVFCEPVKGKVPAYFGDCHGDINTKILTRMKQVLCEDKTYPYLMKNAAARLSQARFSARNSGVVCENLINLGGDMWALFPWLGTYSFFALERFLNVRCREKLRMRGLDSCRPYFIQFTMAADEYTFFSTLREEACRPIDPMELVYPKEVPIFEKYDEYLPAELVRKGFAYGVLDIDGMLTAVNSWCDRFFGDKKEIPCYSS